MTIAHIFNGELGFDVRTKLNDVIDIVNTPPSGGMAIGGAITGGTAGRVLFSGVGGILDDDSTFTWNDTLKDLHIGGAYYVNAARALYVVPHVTENNWFEGNSGNQTLSGYGNFATGDLALSSVTSGFSNVGVGTNALQSLTSGNRNFAFGSNALKLTQTDASNIAIGTTALQNLGNLGAGAGNNQNNVGVGFSAFGNMEQGYANVGIGPGVMNAVLTGTVASFNTVIGSGAGSGLGSGGGSTIQYNTLIGTNAAFNMTGASSRNTFIGTWNGPSGLVNDCIALNNGNGVLDLNATTPWIWSFTFSGYGIPTGIHVYNSQSGGPGTTANYERAIFDWVGVPNVLRIGTQAAGSGTIRPIRWTGLSSKATPIGADSLLLLDSASSGDMKTVLISALPGGGGGTTILDGSGPPADALGSAGDYYVDEDGNQLYGPKGTVASYGPDQLTIPPATTPAALNGFGGYELGGRFTAAVAGRITAIRYYRAATTTQIAHTVSIWTTGGVLLGSGTVTNDGGGSGWKQVALATPVLVTAGTTIVATTEFYVDFVRTNGPGFPISNGGDVSLITGVYGSPGGFPAAGDNTNFFVDVVFQKDLGLAPYWPVAVDGDGAAIGGAITSATAGSVLFAGVGGILAQDNTNFFWDDTLNDLHIGGAYYVSAAKALFVVPNVVENNWFEGNSGNLTVTGAGNFGTGDFSLLGVTTGYNNVAVGTNALKFLTAGYQNLAMGSNALFQTVTDNNNIAIGATALYTLGKLGAGSGNNTGNVALGFGALSNMEQGTSNVAIGVGAMSNLAAPVGAGSNVVIGNRAGQSLGISGGSGTILGNALIGNECGINLSGLSTFNTWIGGYRGLYSTHTVTDRTVVVADGSGTQFLFDCNWTTPYVWSFNGAGDGTPTSVHIYKFGTTPSQYFGTTNYERGELDWQGTSNVFRLRTRAAGTGTKRLIAIDGHPKAGAPASGDLPADSFAVIDDTSAGQTWLVFNKAGSIRKVQLT